MVTYGIPEYIHSDSGLEFIVKDLRKWLSGVGVKTVYITPGSPWGNGSSTITMNGLIVH